VGAELFHADRRTDMTKLIVALHNFTKASTKHKHVHREILLFASSHCYEHQDQANEQRNIL
jgi:hypothetical protein